MRNCYSILLLLLALAVIAPLPSCGPVPGNSDGPPTTGGDSDNDNGTGQQQPDTPECASDADCDDGVFCNGEESCSAAGRCESADNPCDDPDFPICLEVEGVCASLPECLRDADCNDGDVCNGIETCDSDRRECAAGRPLICESDEFCNPAGGCESIELGDLSMILFADDMNPAPGGHVLIDVMLRNNSAANVSVGGYQADMDCNASGGTSGSVTLITGDPQLIPYVDEDSADYVLACAESTFSSPQASCPTANVNAVSLDDPPEAGCTIPGGGERYLGTVAFAVSDDAAGVFQIRLLNTSVVVGSNGSLIDTSTAGILLTVDALPANCIDDADCFDGLFCNGAEVCLGGECAGGDSPCQARKCDESGDICLECIVDADCNGSDDTCVSGSCESAGDEPGLNIVLETDDDTPAPGAAVIIRAFLENSSGVAVGVSGYQADLECSAAGGTSGSVDVLLTTPPASCTGSEDDPLPPCAVGRCEGFEVCSHADPMCSGDAPCIDGAGGPLGLCEGSGSCEESPLPIVDQDRPDYVFACASSTLSFPDNTCPGVGVNAANFDLASGGTCPLADGDRKYLGTFVYRISDDAAGVFELDLRGSSTVSVDDSVPLNLSGLTLTITSASIAGHAD